jgi:Domain of unknown function (DUF1772)
MNEMWAAAMVVSGGLFAGGVMLIALERVPVWRATKAPDFRTGFAQTLRRVDRLQPALLSICLVSTIGFAVTANGGASTIAWFGAVGFLLILVGSAAWLIPIQRTLKADSELPPSSVNALRGRWLLGHLIRTVLAVGLFAVTAAAAIA